MSALRRASSQLLSQRSVHLRIQPRPANLSESREIFRILQRFGEISTYKSLKYEYHNPADNIALAIYRDTNAAQQALNASPIRFALETIVDDGDKRRDEAHFTAVDPDDSTATPSTPRNDSIEELLQPTTLFDQNTPSPTSKPETPPTRATAPMPFEPSPPPQTTSKWFQITLDRSRVVHQDYIERQPYWKHFTPMKSMAQEDLAKTVPHIGLSDVSKRPPNAHRTPTHVLRSMANYVDKGLPSLKRMVEESGGGREDVR